MEDRNKSERRSDHLGHLLVLFKCSFKIIWCGNFPPLHCAAWEQFSQASGQRPGNLPFTGKQHGEVLLCYPQSV